MRRIHFWNIKLLPIFYTWNNLQWLIYSRLNQLVSLALHLLHFSNWIFYWWLIYTSLSFRAITHLHLNLLILHIHRLLLQCRTIVLLYHDIWWRLVKPIITLHIIVHQSWLIRPQLWNFTFINGVVSSFSVIGGDCLFCLDELFCIINRTKNVVIPILFSFGIVATCDAWQDVSSCRRLCLFITVLRVV